MTAYVGISIIPVIHTSGGASAIEFVRRSMHIRHL